MTYPLQQQLKSAKALKSKHALFCICSFKADNTALTGRQVRREERGGQVGEIRQERRRR